MTDQEIIPSLLSLTERRDILRISRPTLFRIISEGHLPVIRIGGRTLVEAEAVKAFIAERRARGPA